MTYTIFELSRITSFLAFLRVGAKAILSVSKEQLIEALDHCANFARKNGVRIHISGIEPEKLLKYAAAGAVAGAAVGIVLGGGIGMVPGAVLGAAVGAVLAHVSISITFDNKGDALFTIN